MEKQSVGKRFYQGQQLVTQVQGPNFSQTLLFAGGRCLSERQSAGNPVNPGLVATEFKGSVIDVVHGNDVTRHTYTPYGYSPAVSAKFPRPGFNGALLELVTGCYMLGNGTRGYDPRIMRFTSPDRLSPFLKGGINSYAYCEGDPVNYSDPTGRTKFSVLSRSRRSVAWAKKQRRDAVQRKRTPYLRAYAEAEPNVKVTIDNAQRRAGWTLNILGEIPQHDPRRQNLLSQVVREFEGIFSFASDVEIGKRYKAFIGGNYQPGRHAAERQPILNHLAGLAARRALESNARIRANRMGEPITTLTPPPSPGR